VADAAFKGEVRGDLVATRSAVLHPTARVVGNIRAPRLVIEEGARFSGSVDMDVELPAGVRSPAA
jgi:cytoskeletal protein CcmA (bactofilin family)